ncbi:type VI secretion system Vgr family protein [Leisingera sp. JC1]|uniref:type VI secretion system Vgr family protein n=1 Tax=Leisingera sp. JC1 TaxID=1855282 RepID=UPI000803B4FE|nr:type VI secretion system tip protein TssI/VgrG [Leisingera sp. JC1]OBY28559.1 type IV secretion protein Rhs [Leisingera sp. JC1]
MNVFTQDARLGRLTTVLGPEALALMRFDGSEALNGLFDYSVEALATRDDLDFDALLGTHATVSISGAEGPALFDGIITEARWKGPGENGWRYDLRLRPWFWLAGKRRNQRIFHNKTVVEILQELLMDYGHLGNPHLEIALSSDYPELEYTVQYRESDLDFARRLMERFGISFHIRHQKASHTLVLSDDVLNHAEIPPRPYYGAAQNQGAQGEHFWAWGPERRLTTGATRLTDYNFKTPTAAMESDRIGDAAYAEGQLEAYDYPGGYLDLGRGKTVAQLRCEEERGHDARQFASGDITGLRPGGVVPLQGGDAVPGDGAKHLCLWARYSFVSQSYGSNRESSSADRPFTADYRLMPLDAPMVPPRVTPLPVVQGPQTAVVVGEGEIDCDEHGRILVHFHWDLEKAYSMRCRVSQNWASQGWGGMVIPRIGMEVVVEFLEGDPDKPLVTGCVYNGRNRAPVELPAKRSRSVFKTKSHQGQGFNELTFEDQSGEEFIYMHAQKDLNMHVENSSMRRVEFDDNVSVGNASNLDVAADRTETIEGALNLKVTGPILEKTDADRGNDVGGSYAVSAGGDLTIKAGGEIVLDAAKITLVAGGAALVLEGGTVNAAPVLNVGSASPGAAALAPIPAVLKAAAGEGTPFVSHCPLKGE